MNISAIVCEYNPFHNGHLYHINKTKKLTGCDALIGVMSGSFVQRGLPAIIDKWSRAKMALNNGIDLVIELPVLYSVSSAEFFAYGAVSLLNSLNTVNSICFGSECGDADTLKKAAKVFAFEPLGYKNKLKQNLSLGISYHKSRSYALNSYLKQYDSEILTNPNNCLGIEYIKSILKLNSNIIPYTIKRQGSSYKDNNLNESNPSATAVRDFINKNSDIHSLKDYVPLNVFDDINNMINNNYEFAKTEKILNYLKYKIMLNGENISNIPDAVEGLNDKIIKNIDKLNNYNDFIKSIKSKRYTYTRISRILCQYFLGFDSFNTIALRKEKCPYARVLGFNKKGREILKILKQTSDIPIYIKLPKNQNDVLRLDINSTYAYSLLNSNIKYNSDYIISPLHFI